jgi:hypothetical protein
MKTKLVSEAVAESAWLQVCGCACVQPKLSAACWISRLVGKSPKPWVLEELQRFPDLERLCIWLAVAVRDAHANPTGLVHLLAQPLVVRRLEQHADFELDLFDSVAADRARAAGELGSSLGDAKSSLGDAKSSLGDAESSLGDAESSLGDAKSSLGDAKSSLGDAESSLGDAKSSLGDP